jgi:P27 family predicted phage terminase small subunit
VLTEADGQLLAIFCIALSQVRQANEVLAEHGMLVTTPNGFQQPRPEIRIRNVAMRQVHQLGAEFGLSPAARARLTIQSADESELSGGIR